MDKKIFEEVKAILAAWFKEEDYEILPNGQVIVHYDKIMVNYWDRNSYPLRDLYVRFHLKDDGRLHYGAFQVMAATVTRKQLDGYRFSTSHTSGGAGEWGTGCFRGPTVQVMNSLQYNYSPERFKAFLASIKTYLEWDGYERAPLFTRRKAVPVERKWVPEATVKALTNKVLALANLKSLLNISISDDGIEVKPTEEFEEQLGKLTGSSVFKDESGQYLRPSGSVDAPEDRPTLHMFKGKPIILKIREVEGDFTTHVAHPDMTAAVCKEITNHLAKFNFKNHGNTKRASRKVKSPS